MRGSRVLPSRLSLVVRSIFQRVRVPAPSRLSPSWERATCRGLERRFCSLVFKASLSGLRARGEGPWFPAAVPQDTPGSGDKRRCPAAPRSTNENLSGWNPVPALSEVTQVSPTVLRSPGCPPCALGAAAPRGLARRAEGGLRPHLQVDRPVGGPHAHQLGQHWAGPASGGIRSPQAPRSPDAPDTGDLLSDCF